MESHTEAEAKTKWCPFARVGVVAGMAVNRHVNDAIEEDCRCRASDCMLWTWDMRGFSQGYDPSKLTRAEKIALARGNPPVNTTPERGYCGAAR